MTLLFGAALVLNTAGWSTWPPRAAPAHEAAGDAGPPGIDARCPNSCSTASRKLLTR